MGGAMAAGDRAGRMRESAEMVMGEFDGDLRTALDLPVAAARKALMKFRMIGEPSADRILAINRKAKRVPLDSNGLRVVQRLGLAAAKKDYRASYRAAQEALIAHAPARTAWLVEAGALLRQHGQELCKATKPKCGECPLSGECPASLVA